MQLINTDCPLIFFSRYKHLSNINNSIFMVLIIGGETIERR